MSELVDRAHRWAGRTAVAEGSTELSYDELLGRSASAASGLLRLASSASPSDLAGRRVCALIPPGVDYVVAQWATWRAGGMWVPLAVSHPERELAYVLDDAAPTCVVVHPSMRSAIERVASDRGIRVVELSELEGTAAGLLPTVVLDRPALMIYTSGTTGRPKGVVTTHANIAAQCTALVEAWGWQTDDHILHVLPLHHVHGIINVLGCALWSGARCTFAPSKPDVIWEAFTDPSLTLFMAVPTVYARLIRAWEEAPEVEQIRWSEGAERLRLMVSGSAALPVPTLERWKALTGQTLLERYGMTEIGMGLTNPLNEERRAGTVGQPFPGVELALLGEDGQPVAPGTPGQIHIRGPQVFTEYWRKPEETVAAFRDGWFITGDEAVLEDGYYRILGRRSVDIIKTGGYKVSALEIESVLREHPQVRDVAVVGIPDQEWGERVCCVLACGDGTGPDTQELRRWAKERLAPYKVPSRSQIVGDLPRNAMGKVVKPEVKALFANQASPT